MTPRKRGVEGTAHSVTNNAQTAVGALAKALLTREEWLRLAAHGSELGLWYWTEVTNELFWDAKTREIFGVTADGDVTLETFYKALHPEDLARVKQIWRYQLESGLPCEVEYRALRPDGSIRWVDARGRGFYYRSGKPHYMIGVVFDVTKRKQFDQERTELSGRLINAQEEERSRLSRELHDDFGQRLSLVTVALDRISGTIKDSAARAPVLELSKIVEEIVTDLYSLSHRLHSPRLEMLGLAETVDRLCKEFSREHGIRIQFDGGGIAKSMPPEIALCLFRIVQEGLHNVQKHSRASRVEIQLKGSPGEISLTLSDDGIGFDLAKSTSDGIGIQSMKERTRMLHGTFEIHSAPIKGTQIAVKVPLKRIHTAA